jgi:DNA-binding NtrC family response regulator
MTEGELVSPEDMGLPVDNRTPEASLLRRTHEATGTVPRAGEMPWDPLAYHTSGHDLPSLARARKEMERRLIRQALRLHGRNIKRAAEHLGVSRVTFYRLMEKYQVGARDDLSDCS